MMKPPQDHELTISVSSKNGVNVTVQCRDQVPDLMSRFSDAVQRCARMSFLVKTRYERSVLKATRDLPWYARMTVRQHLLRDRALRFEALLKNWFPEKAAPAVNVSAHQKVVTQPPPVRGETPVQRELTTAPSAAEPKGLIEAPAKPVIVVRKTVHMVPKADREPAIPDRIAPSLEPVRSEPAATAVTKEFAIGERRQSAGTAQSGPTVSRPSLIEALEAEQPLPKVVPYNVVDRTRGRGR